MDHRMTETFNIYCDESCHLEHDHQGVMVLGAVWSPSARVADLAKASRDLKQEFGLAREFELKWVKVSPARQDYYTAALDWFWNTPDLHFRCLIVADKTRLDHSTFGQTHDEWYYKMYFDLLKVIIDPQQRYNIYLDLKDTRGAGKVRKLHEVLSNAQYDFSRSIIERIQLVRSHEVELLQLADFLTGLIAYVNRGQSGSSAKLALVQRLRQHSGYSLTRTTLLRENKINLFRWQAREDV
jgi:hypothetical protein